MLDQKAIFDANDVRRNPVHREAEVRKSAVHDDEIPFTHNRSMLIFESWRKTLDEIKQALTTGSNVSRRLLDVLQIREALSGVRAPLADGGNLGWRNLVADRGIAVLSARKVALQEDSPSRLTLLRISKEHFQPQVLWWVVGRAKDRRRLWSDVALAISRVVITRGGPDQDELANQVRTVERDPLRDHSADRETEKIDLR